MSGGYWDYRNLNIFEPAMADQMIDIERLKLILITVKKALSNIDYALSGDYNKERVEKELFVIFKKLGDDLYK